LNTNLSENISTRQKAEYQSFNNNITTYCGALQNQETLNSSTISKPLEVICIALY